MKSSPIFLIAAVIALSACKRSGTEIEDPVPTKEVAAGVPLIDYDSAEARFSCRAPRDWGIREPMIKKADGAVFVGPHDPATMGSPYITILKYPESASQYSDAQKYAETFWEIDPQNKQPELMKEKIGEKTVIRFQQERPFYKPHSHKVEYMIRHEYALIPVEGGFYEIEYRAPTTTFAATRPVFEAVVRSFKPKS